MVQPKSYKGIKVEGKIVGMVGSDVQCSGLNVLPANPSFDSFAPPCMGIADGETDDDREVEIATF